MSTKKHYKYTVSLDYDTYRQLHTLKLFLVKNKPKATLNDAIIMAIQETFITLKKKGHFVETL